MPMSIGQGAQGVALPPRAATGLNLTGALVSGESRLTEDPTLVEFFFGGGNGITNMQPTAISDNNAFEFGRKQINEWYVDFTSTGLVTLTLVVPSDILAITNTFKSDAFSGLGAVGEISNNFTATASLSNDTLALAWPRIATPGLYQAVFQLYLQCAPGPLAECCNSHGTYKATGTLCRYGMVRC